MPPALRATSARVRRGSRQSPRLTAGNRGARRSSGFGGCASDGGIWGVTPQNSLTFFLPRFPANGEAGAGG